GGRPGCRSPRVVCGFFRPAGLNVQVDRSLEPGIPGPNLRLRRRTHGLADAVSGVLRGPDPAGGLRLLPGRPTRHHRALHPGPGPSRPPPPRTILLVAPPLEAPTQGR